MDDSPQEQVGLQKPEVAARGPKKHQKGSDINWEEVEVGEARQAGAVHVGHQIWQRLGLDEISRWGRLRAQNPYSDQDHDP
jgi:hypothetical protein